MRYRTIVADPPWDSDDTNWNPGRLDHRGRSGTVEPRATTVPYGCMSLAEIAAIPVEEWADANAHLYLWTTQRFLRASFEVAEKWGFRVSATLVWCKAPMGFMGGTFYGSSTEFCQFATRGQVSAQSRVGRRWFEWPRGVHSAKPEGFIDMVEQVSPEPRLEMFARRARFGWDTWGDQSLGTAQMPGEAA